MTKIVINVRAEIGGEVLLGVLPAGFQYPVGLGEFTEFERVVGAAVSDCFCRGEVTGEVATVLFWLELGLAKTSPQAGQRICGDLTDSGTNRSFPHGHRNCIGMNFDNHEIAK